MQAFLTRRVLLLVVLVGVAGCSPYAVEDIIRTPGTQRYRVDADINRFVAQVDRDIRLDRRQEEHVVRMLRDRTYRLLDRARPSDHRYIYPFPRPRYLDMNAVQLDFWRDADRRIERRLSRSQARRYAYIMDDRTYRRDLFGERFERRGDRRDVPRVRIDTRGRYETRGRDTERQDGAGRGRYERRDD